VQRAETTPEHSGLCGCWQFIAVWRQRQELRGGQVISSSEEYSYYSTSLTKEERSAKELGALIRGHWNAVEIGSHYRRDVTLREDASRVRGPNQAYVLATLRNLVIGLFELEKENGRTKAAYLPNWQRTLRMTHALKLLTKGV
jgi:predicted transposase YbfD/YdcC